MGRSRCTVTSPAALYEIDESSCELHFLSLAFDGAHERWLTVLSHGARLLMRDDELWTPEQTVDSLARPSCQPYRFAAGLPAAGRGLGRAGGQSAAGQTVFVRRRGDAEGGLRQGQARPEAAHPDQRLRSDRNRGHAAGLEGRWRLPNATRHTRRSACRSAIAAPTFSIVRSTSFPPASPVNSIWVASGWRAAITARRA